MGKLKKKGTSGAAKNYITRTQAVRKLQVSLQDFRRLCIFKGIYPREPRNKKKASKSSTPSTTFYYSKDIQYLLHEPLLAKFREHKALAKKIGRALGRGEAGDAKRLDAGRSRMTLDHIVKERYPTFVDALRDLDDALSMLFLFATLPATSHIPPKTIALCQRLCLEFEHYLIISNSLRKSFLSIKGIYYQATIMGQDILWLAPYKFVQNMAGDIDFRIMGTFVEFYTTLLGFVNYRLYTTVGLVYPPKFDKSSDAQGGELGAFKLEGKTVGTTQAALTNGETLPDAPSEEAQGKAQAAADQLASTAAAQDVEPQTVDAEDAAEVANAEKIDEFQVSADAEADVLPQAGVSSDVASTLFAPFTFFLGRETPRAPLEFLLRAFGCKRVGWDVVLGAGAFTSDEKDPRITHQIVDRPQIPALAAADDEEGAVSRTRVVGRTYVQPQWVWDCVNQGKLLRPDLYAPGATLPPHISPWVKPKKGEYDPTLSLAEQEEENEAELDEEEDVEEDEEDEEEEADIVNGGPVSAPNASAADLLDDDSDVAPGEGMDVADDDSDEDSDEESEEADAAFDGFDDDEEAESADEEESAALAYQRELEAEARGQAFNTAAAGRTPAKSLTDKRKKVEKKMREEAEDIERRKMMLPNRKRKLFDKMEYSNKVKDEAAKKLRSKRRKLEKSGA